VLSSKSSNSNHSKAQCEPPKWFCWSTTHTLAIRCKIPSAVDFSSLIIVALTPQITQSNIHTQPEKQQLLRIVTNFRKVFTAFLNLNSCEEWGIPRRRRQREKPSSTSIRMSKFSGCRRLSVKPCAKVSKCLTYAHMRHCRTNGRPSVLAQLLLCCYFGFAICSDSVDNNDNNKRPEPRDLLALWLGGGALESERLSSQSCVLWVITRNGLLTR